MRDRGVAKRYARALVDAAKREGNLVDVGGVPGESGGGAVRPRDRFAVHVAEMAED